MSITVKAYHPEVGVGVTTKKAVALAYNHNPPPSSKRGLRRYGAKSIEQQRHLNDKVYHTGPKRTRDQNKVAA
jgi:hypothetical protein